MPPSWARAASTTSCRRKSANASRKSSRSRSTSRHVNPKNPGLWLLLLCALVSARAQQSGGEQAQHQHAPPPAQEQPKPPDQKKQEEPPPQKPPEAQPGEDQHENMAGM